MKKRTHSGVTLIEMLVVVVIVSVVASVSFPALTAGLASVRLSSASGSAASFLTSTLNNVDRHEEPAALVVSPAQNLVAVYTAASGNKPERALELPAGISIEGDAPHRYLIMPGGAPPHLTLVLRNEKGARRSVEVDPATGVPKVRRRDEAR